MTEVGVVLEGSARLDATPLFSDVRLELAPGGWTCLLGPSGCGKSTILRLIAGLDTGARFDGTLCASDASPLEGRVAYMAQEDLLLPWLDVAGNVAVGARLRGEPIPPERVNHVIGEVGLGPHARKRPGQLSGGQRQRVALARTLMEDRPVVLLDEPFSALDARTRAEMQEVAARTLAGRTALLVTHDPAEAARMGDRVYLMGAGGVEEIAVPPTRAIRTLGAAETLTFGAELMARLRAA
ncbi:MAG: ABC transporter ATP-binding protein [Pseudomonadota bacterium]